MSCSLRRIFRAGSIFFLFSAFSACGEPAVTLVETAAESRSLRFGCLYGVLVEAIIPPVNAGPTTHAEVCFAGRCGTATLPEHSVSSSLGGALQGTLLLDGRGTGLSVNVGENEALRDGDVWQVTITAGEKLILSATQAVTYTSRWDYPTGQEPVEQQCTGVTGRQGYFKVN